MEKHFPDVTCAPLNIVSPTAISETVIEQSEIVLCVWPDLRGKLGQSAIATASCLKRHGEMLQVS